MKTSCEQIEEWMDWQVAGWADAEQVSAVEAHVADCTTCREQARLMGVLADTLAEGEAPVAPVVRVAAPSVRRVGTRWLTWGVVAACAVMAFVMTQREAPVEVASVPDSVDRLAEAPPTWATYSRAATLSEEDLLTVLDAHDRNIELYEPQTTLLAMRGELERLLR